MSTVYGGYGGGGYGPTGKVNYGWISEAWSLFTANAGVWIVAALVASFLPALFGGIIGGIYGGTHAMTTPTNTRPGFGGAFQSHLPVGLDLMIRVVSFVWSAYIFGGVYRMAVKQVRGETIEFADIFSGGPRFGSMAIYAILAGILTVIGFVLCIVPGFIVLGLLLPAYALVGDDVSPIDAI